MAIELSEKIRFYGKEALEERLNVATIADRNAIPLGERYNGMIVTVRAEGKRYELLYDGNFEELSESAKDAFLGDNDNWAESGSGSGTPETPESIKTKYESNEDTNAFTDAEKLKLGNIDAEATKNEDTDDLPEGENNKYFTGARAVGSKLAGYVKAETVEALSSSKSVIEALQILEKALDGKVTLTPGGQLVVAAEKNRWNDTYTKAETDNKIAEKLNNLVWRDAVENASDLPTAYPDAVEGWAAIVNSENALYRFNGTSWGNIGNFIIPKATASVDGLMSKEDFVKLRDIEAEATKNDNTDELDEGTTNKYFTEARAVAAKLTGYMKAGNPGALAETDSILQALGKLEGLLDTKIPIRGDNFIATRPTANKAANGEHLQNIIYELGSFTPNGGPLSDSNRVHVLVMPGEYGIGDDIYLGHPFVDIIGFGSKNGVIINGYIETGFGNQNHRIENITVKGAINLPSNTSNCVYKNLTVDQFGIGANGGLFENIEHSGAGDYLFEGIAMGTLRNIYTPKALGGDISVEFEGIIEDCRAEGQHNPIGLSGTVTRSYFKGNNGYDAIFDLYDGADISYTTIINESDQETGTEWAVTNFKRFGAPDTDKEVRIHHCNFEAKDGALSPKVINTIANGHNSWDEEGGDGSGYSTPAQVKNALEELAGESRLDASAVKGLPTGVTSLEKTKIGNLPSDTNQEITDINNDLLEIGQDIGDLESEVERLKKGYVVDLDFEDTTEFAFKAPEAMKINSVEAQPGTTPTITGYTVGNSLAKYATFTIEVDVPGMVTIKGEML